MVRLEWKTALVTGGSRGIGRGIVLKLAEVGVQRIAVNYVENDRAGEDTASRLRDLGTEAITVKADVGESEGVRRLFDTVRDEFGELGIFVHSARPSPAEFYMPPFEITEEGWLRAFDTQAKAFTLGCQRCRDLMPAGGRIVAITYAPGSRTGSWQSWIAMGGSKAALESTVRYFAVALAEQGVTVNAISPNWIEDSVLNALPEPVYRAIRDWNVNGWTPMRRLGTPADVGNSVALVCAEEASWITGQTIYVDGGASLMNSDLPLEIQLPA
jgi:NAD(P)-dependent dehydrogenase (short-subunit alcohol dehydrogenase family)